MADGAPRVAGAGDAAALRIQRPPIVGVGSVAQSQHPGAGVDLSVGMQQRVGLARAFANEPDILLMDEPFGSLDAQTRLRMQELLLSIWSENRKTVVFVTHDIEEALLLADRILLLSPRPAAVREVIPVNLPRPRGHEILTKPACVQLKTRIMESLFSPLEGKCEDRKPIKPVGCDKRPIP